mmetsp:Transcript_29331/g.75607  ORF Transcript_29331/g.75607 Transcript_29331/m.75607 type:complete len:586 (-) Transcript_29331:234-1991(-)
MGCARSACCISLQEVRKRMRRFFFDEFPTQLEYNTSVDLPFLSFNHAKEGSSQYISIPAEVDRVLRGDAYVRAMSLLAFSKAFGCASILQYDRQTQQKEGDKAGKGEQREGDGRVYSNAQNFKRIIFKEVIANKSEMSCVFDGVAVVTSRGDAEYLRSIFAPQSSGSSSRMNGEKSNKGNRDESGRSVGAFLVFDCDLAVEKSVHATSKAITSADELIQANTSSHSHTKEIVDGIDEAQAKLSKNGRKLRGVITTKSVSNAVLRFLHSRKMVVLTGVPSTDIERVCDIGGCVLEESIRGPFSLPQHDIQFQFRWGGSGQDEVWKNTQQYGVIHRTAADTSSLNLAVLSYPPGRYPHTGMVCTMIIADIHEALLRSRRDLAERNLRALRLLCVDKKVVRGGGEVERKLRNWLDANRTKGSGRHRLVLDAVISSFDRYAQIVESNVEIGREEDRALYSDVKKGRSLSLLVSSLYPFHSPPPSPLSCPPLSLSTSSCTSTSPPPLPPSPPISLPTSFPSPPEVRQDGESGGSGGEVGCAEGWQRVEVEHIHGHARHIADMKESRYSCLDGAMRTAAQVQAIDMCVINT